MSHSYEQLQYDLKPRHAPRPDGAHGYGTPGAWAKPLLQMPPMCTHLVWIFTSSMHDFDFDLTRQVFPHSSCMLYPTLEPRDCVVQTLLKRKGDVKSTRPIGIHVRITNTPSRVKDPLRINSRSEVRCRCIVAFVSL